MTAGSPNWQKLFEIGKLPKEARGKVSGLAQLDAAEKRIEEIRKLVCADCLEKIFGMDTENKPKEGIIVKEPEVTNITGGSPIKVRCEVEGCDYVGEGRTEGIVRNILRMHGKIHEVKKEE